MQTLERIIWIIVVAGLAIVLAATIVSRATLKAELGLLGTETGLAWAMREADCEYRAASLAERVEELEAEVARVTPDLD